MLFIFKISLKIGVHFYAIILRVSFLICGDFNARTASHPDYVEDDNSIHMHVLPDDYQLDAPMQRTSEDCGFNKYGTNLLDFCKLTGFRILNGRVGQDRNIGKYTYVGSTGKSLVDYVIASQALFPAVCTFRVDDPNILSDHCLIHFSLSSAIHQQEESSRSGTPLMYKYVWDSAQAEAYQASLEAEDIKVAFTNLISHIDSAETADDINSNISSFQKVMDSACAPLFKRNIPQMILHIMSQNSHGFQMNVEKKEVHFIDI